MDLNVEINSDGQRHAVAKLRLRKAARAVLREAGIRAAEISIAIVNDARMHELNRRYLQHDYPTDVLSFLLHHDEHKQSLEGEIIASADYAAREALLYGWSTNDELLLYIIHGCLHLVGYDDTNRGAKKVMRAAEASHLKAFGLKPVRRKTRKRSTATAGKNRKK